MHLDLVEGSIGQNIDPAASLSIFLSCRSAIQPPQAHLSQLPMISLATRRQSGREWVKKT